jgi:hypothetical protein
MNRAWAAATLATTLGACEAEIDIPPPRPAPGTVTLLESGGERGRTGWWPSAVFDARDRPHVSYCDAHDADLMYATRTDGAWQIRAVVSEGNVGKYTALDVDSHDRPGIAFYDQDKKYLRYAWQQEDGTWKDERVAWGLEVGMGSELRFDDRDLPHLFYYIPSGKLIHAHKTGGKWVKRVVADATGGFSVRISPVLRPDGFWISFVDWRFKDTALHLARPTADGFEVELIGDRRGPGWRSQLLFEGDTPAVVFSRSSSEDLRIARRDGDGWRFVRLVRQAGNFAATTTVDGGLLVAYEDVAGASTGAGILKLLRREGGAWRSFTIDTDGPVGSYLALAADSAGRALVAYYAGNIRGIRVYEESR